MKKIVFAGGGTAGHIMPNIALIDELKSEFECVYVGTNGMEKDICAARNIPFFEIDAVKVRRDAFIKNFAVPFKLARSVSGAKKLLKSIAPDLVFSKGGYAALPVALAARSCKARLLVHESDLSAGLVTKLTAKRAEKSLFSFEPCAAKFKNGVYTGSPIRRELFAPRLRAKEKFGFKGGKPMLLVVGGSSGAAAINECVKTAVPRITKKFNVLHITGKNKPVDFVCDGYKTLPFTDDMASVYAAADVAVTRAGANALAELISLRIPSLAIPLEKASRGDQIQNAEYYKSKGAILTLRESEMTPDSLTAAVLDLYKNRIAFASAMSELKVDGTKRICDIIRSTAMG